MQRFFVWLLSITLMLVGFVCLLAAGTAAGFAMLAIVPSIFADTSNSHLSVRYAPISEISGSVPRPAENNARGNGTQDTPLKRVATENCRASEKLLSNLTDGEYGYANFGGCVSDSENAAVANWGDRAQNYLEANTAYWAAVRADPQTRTKYPSHDSNTVFGEYQGHINRDFDALWAKEVDRDEKRKAQAEATVLTGKASAIVLGGVAISAFLTFLFVAFLIVATRIEKHLGTMAQNA